MPIAHLQRETALATKRAYRFDDRESGVRRALGIVLVGARVAEKNQSTVAQELGHMTVEARDRRCDSAVERPNEITHVLGVKPSR